MACYGTARPEPVAACWLPGEKEREREEEEDYERGRERRR